MTNRYDVIIIGGGPAGAQCALWLKMLGYDPAIVEKSSQLGGLQNRNPYPNHWIVTSPHNQNGYQTAKIIHKNIDQKDIAVYLNADIENIVCEDEFRVVLKNPTTLSLPNSLLQQA